MINMKQKTISLKDEEEKSLLEIMRLKNVKNLHAVIKMAITDFIKKELRESQTKP